MRPAYQYTTQPYLEVSWSETSVGAPIVHYEWKYFRDWERWTSGANTPNFFQRKRSRNRLPVNSYSMTTTRRTGTIYGIQENSLINGHTLGGLYTSTHNMFPAHTPFYFFNDSNIITEANNRAVLKLNDRLSAVKVNYAQFFAERKQTAKLLGDTAFRIVQAASSLRRGDLTGFTRSLSLSATQRSMVAKGWKYVTKDKASKRIANHWLEYQYGWKPLLSDVYGSAELLARNAVSPKKPHGSLKVKVPISKTFSQPPLLSGYPHFTTEINASLTGSMTLSCDYVLDDESASALAETGISNPALLAWELLPYSFVVDWFVPVGTYLGNLTAQDGFKLSACCTTTFRRSETTMFVGFYKGPLHPSWYESLPKFGVFTQKDVSMTRSNALPSYALMVRNPLGGNPAQRVMTALSLLRQLFR